MDGSANAKNAINAMFRKITTSTLIIIGNMTAKGQCFHIELQNGKNMLKARLERNPSKSTAGNMIKTTRSEKEQSSLSIMQLETADSINQKNAQCVQSAEEFTDIMMIMPIHLRSGGFVHSATKNGTMNMGRG